MRPESSRGRVSLRARMARTLLSLALMVLVFSTGSASADVIDAANDFIGTYTGVKNGDLDVISTDVVYDINADTFHFTGTMNDKIGTTAGVSYVWGLDRGAGTARFASIGVGGVLFDSVVILTTAGVSVRDIVGNATTFTAGTSGITIDGATIAATIPASALVSKGFTKPNYTFNLWPRLAGGTDQIADFAPDNSNAGVRTVPEPASLAMLGLGGVAVWGRLKRNRKRAEVA